jgi:hypothetical protein
MNAEQAIAEEIRRDWQKAYGEMERAWREATHALRNEEQANALLLNLLAQLRDNPNAVGDRVDRVLGRVVEL